MKKNKDNAFVFLISTFDEREKYLDVFFYFFYKFFKKDYIIYLAKPSFYILKEDVNIKQINKNFLRTNNNLGLCSSWGNRLYDVLLHIKEDGYRYIVWMGDDMWIRNVDFYNFNKICDILKKYNADRLQLCGLSLGYKYHSINSYLKIIDSKTKVPWYLNHQTSLWKVDSLLEVLNKNDCATNNERIGSLRAKKRNHKYLCTYKPIIDSLGVVHSMNGLNKIGEELLREYCNYYNLNYFEERKKFPYKKKRSLWFKIKNLPGCLYYKVFLGY